MANPDPPRDNLSPPWRPGQSGNPAGYSRSRRIGDALIRYIEDNGLEMEIVETLVKMGLGRTSELCGRDPQFPWFRELMDRVDGKVTDKIEQTGRQTIRVTYDDQPPDHDQPAPPASGPEGDPAQDEAVQCPELREAVREDEAGDLPAGPPGP